jgi:hypothetical protein
VCLIKLKETINVSEAAGTEMTSIEWLISWSAKGETG